MIGKLFYFGFIFSLLTSPIFVSSTSHAALDGAAVDGFREGINKTNSLDTDQKCVNAGGKFDTAENKCLDKNTGDPFTGDSIGKSIQNVINILLYIAGVIAVIYIVISGFRYVFSNGDSGSITKAKNTLIYAVVGLAIAVMAYAIVNFILNNTV